MAPLLDSTTRRDQAIGLARMIVASLIVLAVFIALSVALGWTLTAGPSFEITPDPAGNLPF